MPENPRALARLSIRLFERGQRVECADVLKRAMNLAPAEPLVVDALRRIVAAGQECLSRGQAAAALAMLLPLSESTHADGRLLMLTGAALMSVGKKRDARCVFERWLEREPDHHTAPLALAAALADEGESRRAESLARRAIARFGASAQASFILGRALLGQSRFTEAEEAFREAVAVAPNHKVARTNLMELVWMRTGDVALACSVLGDGRSSGNPATWAISRARLLESAGRADAALAELESALVAAPSDPSLLKAAVTVALDVDAVAALRHAQHLHASLPDDPEACAALGNALLGAGQGAEALEVADAMCHAHPSDNRAWSIRADALRLGRDPAYRDLLNYRDLVRPQLIDTPPGWANRHEYVAALVRDLDRMHTLHAHPIGSSLRGGSQVQLHMDSSDSAAIRAFPAAVRGAIDQYLEAVPHHAGPMVQRHTGHYRISGAWSVRLRADGFHTNHYHPNGWISSVCYLRLPASARRPGGEGWLKFGEPGFPTRPRLTPEYYVKPEAGLLVLFPSYMWHGTVPFSGAAGETRMTIAFDAVPVA